jgi:hypothetical protein
MLAHATINTRFEHPAAQFSGRCCSNNTWFGAAGGVLWASKTITRFVLKIVEIKGKSCVCRRVVGTVRQARGAKAASFVEARMRSGADSADGRRHMSRIHVRT